MYVNSVKNHTYISIATSDDVDMLMKFIDKEWRRGHILGVNKDFFLYEYQRGKLLNFVVAKNERNEIKGMLGFLRSSSSESAGVWTTMWKVSKDCGIPMLGVKLLQFLQGQGYRPVMSVGINHKTEEIYKYLGMEVGELDHYYIPNQNINEYKISVFANKALKKEITFHGKNNFAIKEISLNDLKENFDFKKIKATVPIKDLTYIENRFYLHPIYKYVVYGVFDGTEIISMVVTRICKFQDATCMRIVDFYGDEYSFGSLVWHLVKIMHSHGHEYIDMYCKGLTESCVLGAGFMKMDYAEDGVIIPNYFEPFLKENVRIKYFIDCHAASNLRVFKADGDQDRPSLQEEVGAK